MKRNRIRRTDVHHPHVHRSPTSGWGWQCDCGGSSSRRYSCESSWHVVLVGALHHASSVMA